MREEKKAAPAAPAQEAGEQPLPLLVRDIAADLSTTPIQVCKALADLGFGGHSVNMVVTPQMAKSLRAHFAATAQAAPAAAAGPIVAYRISDPNEPDLGHWLSEEPGAAWCKSEPLCLAAPTAQAALLEALKEAQAGLEFAAARLPHTTGFVPSHIAALNIVNAALAAAPTTQEAPQQEALGTWAPASGAVRKDADGFAVHEFQIFAEDSRSMIGTSPQAAPVAQGNALTYEQSYAIRQGHEIASSDAYFEARPQIDNNDRRGVFRAGFDRGWDAARTHAKEGGA